MELSALIGKENRSVCDVRTYMNLVDGRSDRVAATCATRCRGLLAAAASTDESLHDQLVKKKSYLMFFLFPLMGGFFLVL